MGDGFGIRRAGVADATAVASVHATSAGVAYASIFPRAAPKPSIASLRPGWHSTLVDPDAVVFVAHEGDDVRAVIALVRDDAVTAGWRLTRLYVHPETWGKGMGRALHGIVLAEARVRGLTQLNLWVLEGNDRARAMYGRWGWRLVPGATLPNSIPEIFDVLYRRDL
jgi:GNAT superfamily N-acetyltransferase